MNAKFIAWLVIVLIFYSSISSSYEAYLLLLGDKSGLLSVQSSWLYRAPREFLLFILCIHFTFYYFKDKKLNKYGFNKSFYLYSYFVLYYIVIKVLITVLSYPFIVPLTGLRIFEYVPVFFIMYVYFSEFGTQYFKKNLEITLKIFIIIQTVFALYELFNAPPIEGSTLFGTRVFGSFSHPNVFGLTMAVIAFVFVIMGFKNNKRWVLLLFTLTIMSGSRLAQLLIMTIPIIKILFNLKSYSLRMIYLQLMPIIGIFIYMLVKLPSFSGRNIQGEERLDVWADIFKNYLNIIDLFFGWGVGLGSNSLTTIFGSGYFKGQFVSDSLLVLLVSSFGILGLFLCLVMLFIPLLFLKGLHLENWILILSFFLLSGTATVVLELFPVNVIIFVLMSYVLAVYRKVNIEL